MPSLEDKAVARAPINESALTRRQPDVLGEPPPASAVGAATIDINPHPLIHGTYVTRGLMHSTLPVVIFDTELRVSWANEAAGKTTNDGSAAHWRGRPLGEVMPGIDVGPIEQSLRGVLQTGRPAVGLQVTGPPCDNTRGERFWSCLQFPIQAPDDGCTGVVHVMWEVTQRARDERQQALANLASARIGTTLNVTRTAEELVDVAVPGLADVGAVDLLDTVIKGDDLARQAIDDRMRLSDCWVSGWFRSVVSRPDWITVGVPAGKMRHPRQDHAVCATVTPAGMPAHAIRLTCPMRPGR